MVDESSGSGAITAVSTQLAYDLASGLWEREIVLAKHGVDDEMWEVIRRNHRFRELVREAYTYWNGKEGQDRRIRAKAKLMLEESLPSLFSIAGNSEAPATARIAAIERMEKLSGIAADDIPANGGGGSMFAITINLGDEKMNIRGNSKMIEGSPAEVVDATAE